ASVRVAHAVLLRARHRAALRSVARLLLEGALLPGGIHPSLPLVGAERAERLLRPHRILVGPGPLELLYRADELGVVARDRLLGGILDQALEDRDLRQELEDRAQVLPAL